MLKATAFLCFRYYWVEPRQAPIPGVWPLHNDQDWVYLYRPPCKVGSLAPAFSFQCKKLQSKPQRLASVQIPGLYLSVISLSIHKSTMGFTDLRGDFSNHRENLTLATSSITKSESKDVVLRRAYRKIDTRLLTWYAFVWVIVNMESHNVTNAVGLYYSTDVIPC